MNRKRSAWWILAALLLIPAHVSADQGDSRVRGLEAALLGAAPPTPEGPAPAGQGKPAGQRVNVGPNGNPGDPEGPRPSAPSPASMGLSRTSDGQFVYEDRGGRFTATVRRDGSVLFADAWRRTSPDKPDAGKCCGVARPGLLNPLAGISMAGPTEWLMRAHGIDPSRSAKTEFLESTLELRINLAVAWTVDRINERLDALDFEMLEIWSDGSTPEAERRELIFHRWDECDENFKILATTQVAEARSEIDRYRAEAAEIARDKIENFVRRHLPRGSTRAYSKEELKRLNAQRLSVQTFAPYAATGP